MTESTVHSYEIPSRPIDFHQIMEREHINIHAYSPWRVFPHIHEHFEIGYVMHGSTVHTVNNKTYILREGDLFLIDKGIPHGYNYSKEFHLVNLCFYPDVVGERFFNVGSVNDIAASDLLHFNPDFSQDYSTIIIHDTDGHIRYLLGELARELQYKRTGYHTIVRGYLMQLLIYFFRNADQRERTGFSPEITEIIRNVSQYYMERNSIVEFTSQTFYSANHLGKKFKEETGTNFKKHLQDYRLQKAATLLTTTDYSIDLIASSVGYQNAPFFYRIFKAYYGITPLHYRKSKRFSP